MISGFLSLSEDAADKIVRGTMLVDHLFEAIVFKKDFHQHSIQKDIYYDFMTLL